MAIRPVQEQWTIYVKGLTGETLSFTIEKDSTVRKMYRQVRRLLKANSSIKIILQTASQHKSVPKSDERISAAGITNNCQLYIIVEQVPDTYKVTLNFLAPIGTKTIYIAENKTTADLFQEVKKVIAISNENLPTVVLLCGDNPIKENRNSLQGEIFDGIELSVQLVMMTVMVNVGNSVRTVNISPGASVGQLFKKVKEVVPTLQCNQQLRLIMGEIDFRENSTQTLQDTGVRHGSSVFAVIRTVGGSDPRITWLFECKEKVITGVRTPSLRACPHCGALVEHSAACKHMKCPACGKEFCFICLSKRDEKGVWIPLYGQTGWQCGRYNTSCNPAPRQTNIPG